jgi:hypothetical protein
MIISFLIPMLIPLVEFRALSCFPLYLRQVLKEKTLSADAAAIRGGKNL